MQRPPYNFTEGTITINRNGNTIDGNRNGLALQFGFRWAIGKLAGNPAIIN